MRIKKFEARNMTQAFNMIKSEFGPDAVILSAKSYKTPSGFLGVIKKPGVEVTAAMDVSHGDARLPGGNRVPPTNGGNGGSPGAMGQAQSPSRRRGGRPATRHPGAAAAGGQAAISTVLKRQLLGHGVDSDTIDEIIAAGDGLSGPQRGPGAYGLAPLLAAALKARGITSELSAVRTRKPRVIALLGSPGVGKTLTAAKLAAAARLRQKQRVALISLDNQRIAAASELKVYSRILGVPMEMAAGNRELKAGLKAFKERDLIIVDTPGVNPRHEAQLGALQATFQKMTGVEKHLLINVTAKEKDIRDTIKRFGRLALKSLLFTRLDETDAYGTVLNQAFASGMNLSYVTDGQQVPENLQAATPERLAALFLAPVSTGTLSLGTDDVGRAQVRPEVVRSNRFREYYVANANSDVFHRPGCRWAQKIKPDNKLVFDSYREARQQEFKACSLCRPQPSSQPLAEADPKPRVRIGNYNY